MKVLIIGYVWPEPCSSAAGLRSWNLVESCLSAQWSLSFASVSQVNAHTQALQDRGVRVLPIQMNDPQFNAVLKELQPDLVIFDRFVTEEQFGWRVREVCPQAARVVDTQDLHSLRRARQQALSGGASLFAIRAQQLTQNQEPGDDLLRELAAILRSDATLILSDYELQLLTREWRIDPELLFLSRFHYGVPPVVPTFAQRTGFVMIGNFRHPPNVDGLRWFASQIWPNIRAQLPDAQVNIYGAYPSREVMAMTQPKLGFFVEGQAGDAFQVLSKARVNLAPLRFGAGIKGKITDGWWAGTPVVATPLGAEGMSEDLPWGGEIASDATTERAVDSAKTEATFAQACVLLHQDAATWQEKQACGYQILSTLYSAEKNSAALVHFLAQLVENLPSRRKRQVLSAVLNFQLNQGTKYFSKWIETKTRVKLLEESLKKSGKNSGDQTAAELQHSPPHSSTASPVQVSWAPFRVGALGELLQSPRPIDTVAGVGDRLRAAAFAELQARDAFRWAAEVFVDAPPGLADAWKNLALEEQKHMHSLLDRMKELEIEMGERPVSDRLWHSLMACTTARDFALYMASAEERGQRAGFKFHQALCKSDPVTAQIFFQIAQEEATHIALAKKYF